jgi:hypothetical protein
MLATTAMTARLMIARLFDKRNDSNANSVTRKQVVGGENRLVELWLRERTIQSSWRFAIVVQIYGGGMACNMSYPMI